MTTFAAPRETTETPPPQRRPRSFVYPTSDGKPMAETDKHADLMVYAKEALRLYFANRAADVYVSGNNFVFWKEGNPRAKVSPDVYVVFGAAHLLGLELVMDGEETLRFYDPAGRGFLPALQESEAGRMQAETENERLRAELEDLKQRMENA